ncbi:hypothetical protein HYW21_04895 [Candidatus Woesearchaeota archaeon]|nr:hypothetical protein [Candidatus Woesearchaeota archaeon]
MIFFHKKKGSLSLSINAVVVLVLAIAMLGLGLAFTKGMFSKLQSKLEIPPPDYPATAEDPLVVPLTVMPIEQNKDTEFSFNFYNTQTDPCTDCFPAITCVINAAPTSLFITGLPQTVTAATAAQFKILAAVPSGTASGKYACKIVMTPQAQLTNVFAQTQFFIQVK